MALATFCARCGRVIPSGTYCAACRPPKARKGSTRAWRNLREHVLRRDQGRCHYCGGAATEVDHIVPVSRGGLDVESNLVASCRDCNRTKGSS